MFLLVRVQKVAKSETSKPNGKASSSGLNAFKYMISTEMSQRRDSPLIIW
ncbi:hypothetical protein J1TS3_01170 [Siminovitchia fordii]|uniref:Uncharacterized protein n=1 Tax=Siminovitchia fordii TaxID=254759 RepID=A0ABQ4JZL2_9BACI|nr:hypothetical protein J1TS3_01170 [Siminovitchia fordii]